MFDKLVSYFNPPKSNTTPARSVSLSDVFRIIAGDELKESTEHLRSLRSSGQLDEYRTQKTNLLPMVTFGGVFDKRKKDGLKTPSSFMTIDIDGLSGSDSNPDQLSLSELKKRFAESSGLGVRLIFTSPSGDGLKVICESGQDIKSDEENKRVFLGLVSRIEKDYNIKIDRSGKDISRACLLCHDPEAIYRDNFEDVYLMTHEESQVGRSQTPLREVLHLHSFRENDGIDTIVRRVEESGKDIAPTYEEYFKLVCSFTSLGERGRELLHRVCALSPKYNPTQTDKDFDYCTSQYSAQSIGTFVNMARESGVDVNNPVEISRENHGKESSRRTVEESGLSPHGPEAVSMSVRMRFPEYFKDMTEEGLTALAMKRTEDIETGYTFGPESEPMRLPGGAITLICGKSSHGKTKFLQNLALQLAKQPAEGEVLYFGYEESQLDTVCQIANINANQPGLSCFGTKNVEVIRDYFKTHEFPRAVKNFRGSLTNSLEELKRLLFSGRLRVFYCELFTNDLCEVIREYARTRKVKAVFIDYAQLLYIEGYKKASRTEEIKEICNNLRTVAIDTGLPVVLSAQLNRQAKSPTDMSEDNIADSADLTRYANTIALIWNSAFDNVEKDYKNSPDYAKLLGRGFELGVPGKLYAKLTKNRGGTPYIDTILEFIGETGYISTNDDLPRGETYESAMNDEFKLL